MHSSTGRRRREIVEGRDQAAQTVVAEIEALQRLDAVALRRVSRLRGNAVRRLEHPAVKTANLVVRQHQLLNDGQQLEARRIDERDPETAVGARNGYAARTRCR